MTEEKAVPTTCIVCSANIASGLHNVCTNRECQKQVARTFKAVHTLRKTVAELTELLDPAEQERFKASKRTKDHESGPRIHSDAAGTSSPPNPVTKTK